MDSTERTVVEQPVARPPSLRSAWICVGLIPVGIVAAFVVGEGLLSAQGYTETAPLGPTLLAAGPAVVIMLLPAVAALVLGLRARRRGVPRGIVPAVIGGAVAAYALLANLLPLLLRVVGG